MMSESVQECRSHPLSLENLVPLAERQIARHQDAAALVAVGENPQQQLDSPLGSSAVPAAQLVTDREELRPVELAEKPVERVLLLLLFQLADQRRGREELHLQQLRDTLPSQVLSKYGSFQFRGSPQGNSSICVLSIRNALAPRFSAWINRAWH